MILHKVRVFVWPRFVRHIVKKDPEDVNETDRSTMASDRNKVFYFKSGLGKFIQKCVVFTVSYAHNENISDPA